MRSQIGARPRITTATATAPLGDIMTHRTTRQELDQALAAFAGACHRANIHRIVSTWANNGNGEIELNWNHLAIDYGSKTYGRAFRLFYVNPNGGGHYSLNSIDDYLGMTKAEAVRTLRALTTGIYAALDANTPAGSR